MTFWLVPQAFHETFWSATPTGDGQSRSCLLVTSAALTHRSASLPSSEFRVTSVLGLIHGVKGGSSVSHAHE